jgi:hypothetical protein
MSAAMLAVTHTQPRNESLGVGDGGETADADGD